MLKLRVSNRFEALRDRLLDDLGSGAGAGAEGPGVVPAPSLMAQETVVVGSAAMRRRLTLDIARERGICAQVQFPFLGQWIWQRIAALQPGVAVESPFEADTLVWGVLAAFNDAAFTAGHDRLAAWLQRADDGMRFDLAREVAERFENYVTWRPDWMSEWTNGLEVPTALQRAVAQSGGQPGGPSGGRAGGRADAGSGASQVLEDARWQGALWRRLFAQAELESQHPARRFVQQLQGLDAQSQRAAGLPAHLHVFGLPSVAPIYMDLLQAIAGRTACTLYLLNPCREYWFDLVPERRLAWLRRHGRDEHREEGHALLAGWGGQIQLHLGRWMELQYAAEPETGDFDSPDGQGEVDDFRSNAELDAMRRAAGAAPRSLSLLQRVQDSILDLSPLQGTVDRSLEFHVCHSALRELEVLQDRLLGLFAHDATLCPGDVLVVLADLPGMAPLVDAVFGTAVGNRRLPYVLSGRSRRRANVAVALLDHVLDFLDSRCTAPQLLRLLDHDCVRRRFGIDAQDHAVAMQWLREAGYRWAFDAQQVAAAGLPPADSHTWSAALDRLLLQYASVDGCMHPFGSIAGAAVVEGQQAFALLARLGRCLETLDAWRQRLSASHTGMAWATLLLQLIEGVAQPSVDEAEDFRELRLGIGAMRRRLQAAQDAGTHSMATIRRALALQFDQGGSAGLPTGSITFVPLGAMRGLPYRHIAVLGLDAKAFPRPSRLAEFDLMDSERRPLDPDMRSGDRAYFLALLLCARDSLHLSFVGRDARNNEPRSPSVVVDELLDWLQAEGEIARNALRVEHPLQPSSPSAFIADPTGAVPFDERRLGRDPAMADAVLAALEDPLPGPPPFSAPATAAEAAQAAVSSPQLRVVDLNELLQFLKDPAAHWLRRRIGIDLFERDDSVSAVEPLHAEWRGDDWFGARAMDQRLLHLALERQADEDTLRALARAWPQFAPGPIGDLDVGATVNRMVNLAQRVRHARGAQGPGSIAFAPIRIDLDGEEWLLQGNHDDLHEGGIVIGIPGKCSAPHALQAWARHLALQLRPVPGMAVRTRVLQAGQGDGCEFGPVRDDAAATRALAALLRVFRDARHSPQPLFVRTSLAWAEVHAEAQNDGRSEKKAKDPMEKARKAFDGSDPDGESGFRSPGERFYAATELVWRGVEDPLADERFEALAQDVFGPLVAARHS